VPTIQATSSGSGASVTGVLAECQQFGGGYSWGSVRNVDITFAGTQETVSNIPMQVMGDMEPAPAANCAALSTTGYELTGSTTNASGVAIANPLTYQYLGANGIVGLSLFAQDCDICTTTAEPPLGTGTTPGLVYAVCADSTGNHCTPTTLPLNQQVVNPVAMLATDNNGFLIRMPPVGTAGAASATGSIIFGIGTQSNNALGNVTKYLADPNEEPGFVYTTYDAVANQFGIFDSGSSLYYFEDPTGTIQLCGTTAPADQYYCPGGSSAQSGAAGTTLHLTATINDWLNDAEPSAVTPFSITNLVNLASTSYAANDIGGPQVLDYFIWGMPSFYGKTLYFGVSSAANNNASPFYAF
jgi:hypothetical protein